MVAEVKLPYGRDWIRELRNGIMDAIIAFLLVQLSNLRFLLLADNFTKECEFLGAVLQPSIEELKNVATLLFPGYLKPRSNFGQPVQVLVTKWISKSR